ncbi:DNA-directed DNA polymerase gamma MIP1 [Sugiyamaella lignohabitans]|uniref:DNA polymerase gamma n=1 Tax=Sugiyamaella lignohabitans TaxID=796027 RepID=A0A167EFM7_9ASCO|nr:DNA-directed DNA polymerase gamma MIP1 [Sugiyamaella lignohabitans]ANB14021.1 DNA-directed DNA polymerase gamma MIP1 [Sugiyamaella lignohabitans]
MRSRVFGTKPQILPDVDRIEQAKEHLALNNLLGKKTSISELIKFPVPELIGKDLDEHFHHIGRHMSEPYLTMATNFVRNGLPTMPSPETWIRKSGWTRYDPDGSTKSVPYPDDSALVFDTEVLYKISDFPVLAVAASEKAWYGWVSPWLLEETENPRQLVPLGTREKQKLVVGHNVGYDRKRVKDEYHITSSKSFFLDTMSLHIAVNGMCSRQRPAWMKMNKKKKNGEQTDEGTKAVDEFAASSKDRMGNANELPDEQSLSCDLEENPWFTHSALNNLADVAMLHCNIKMDKTTRDYFGTLDRRGVVDMFGDLMEYCATDVDVTYKVFQKVLPNFLEVCNHPVSFGALRHLSSCFLPINQEWEQFVEGAEKQYQEVQLEIYNRLKKLADDAVAMLSEAEDGTRTVVGDNILKDPWLSQLDWTIKPIKMVKGKKKGEPSRPAKNQKLPGMPQWYKDLYPTAASPMNISLRTRVAPLLLRLQWDEHPLFWVDSFGWIFKVKGGKETAKYTKLNYTRCDMTSLSKEELEKLGISKRSIYFKIPHNDGQAARCTNPMAKQYVSYFDRGVLSSQFEYAKSAVELNSQCTYWISSRERISRQMPIYDEDTDMGISNAETGDSKFGMIIPKIIPMGTVTRRAVEDLWLTASNAKKSRIGSELKAMVKAPAGYKFVGADVDSEELWIASVIGDSLFGIHGGTALGWMTLEGNKNDGTDLHSRTANILGISRNEAKVFNYGRIYGAGLKFAIQLLKQFNPLITDKEAEEAATKLYDATKGKKARSNAFKANRFWRGGSESIVFNRLEEMAEQDVPRTPVLGASVTQALMKQNLRKSNFLTSRINWTIQSSGVDYLHLLIASMDYLISKFNIEARLVITVHDEIRYLVKEEDKYRAALALQISNLWTRAMFCQQLGIDNVPQSVAFFSLIDIDHVLRKEVDLDCVTPSHPEAIPHGEAISIVDLLKICSDLAGDSGSENPSYATSDYKERIPVLRDLSMAEPNMTEYLAAQITCEKDKFQSIVQSVKNKSLKRPRRVNAKRDSGADDSVSKVASDQANNETKDPPKRSSKPKSTVNRKKPGDSSTSGKKTATAKDSSKHKKTSKSKDTLSANINETSEGTCENIIENDTSTDLDEAVPEHLPIRTSSVSPFKFPESSKVFDNSTIFFDNGDFVLPTRSEYREY